MIGWIYKLLPFDIYFFCRKFKSINFVRHFLFSFLDVTVMLVEFQVVLPNRLALLMVVYLVRHSRGLIFFD